MKAVTDDMKSRFRIDVCYGEEVVRQNYPYVIKLPKDTPLDLALDQSTSQTGLAVFTSYGDLICTVDFINKGLKDYTDYAGMLTLIMKISLAGTKINSLVYEKHSRMQDKADKALMKLKGTIDMWRFEIPELSKVQYGEIYPQTWRKHFLRQAPEYKGRYQRNEVKECAREECAKRYPNFKHHFYFYTKPQDSCDAVGIMNGYVAENWKDGWNKKDIQVNNTMEKENNHAFFYHVDLYDLASAMKEIKQRYAGNIVTMKYNTKYSIAENCKIATSNTNAVCVIIVSTMLDTMCCMWETGKEFEKGKIFLIVTQRVNPNNKLSNQLPRT